MAKTLQQAFAKAKLTSLVKQREELKLEYFIYLFLPIYGLLAALFWSAGYYGRVFFVVVSLVFGLLILAVVAKFIFYLANLLNKPQKALPGLLFAKSVFLFIVPILLLKLVGFMMLAMAPGQHPTPGIICDSLMLMRRLYFGFNVQQNLTYLAWGSIALLAIYLFDVLRRKS